MKGKEKLKGCRSELIALIERIDEILYEQYDEEFEITSAFRKPGDKHYRRKSFHSFGLAADGSLTGPVIFEWIYYAFLCVRDWEMNGFTVAEFEVVRHRNGRQHLHLAIDDRGREIQFFTREYEKEEKEPIK